MSNRLVVWSRKGIICLVSSRAVNGNASLAFGEFTPQTTCIPLSAWGQEQVFMWLVSNPVAGDEGLLLNPDVCASSSSSLSGKSAIFCGFLRWLLRYVKLVISGLILRELWRVQCNLKF